MKNMLNDTMRIWSAKYKICPHRDRWPFFFFTNKQRELKKRKKKRGQLLQSKRDIGDTSTKATYVLVWILIWQKQLYKNIFEAIKEN